MYLKEVYKRKKKFKNHVGSFEEGIKKVTEILHKALDKNLDKFELYVLNNIFKFPDGVDPSVDLQKKSTVHTEEDEVLLDLELEQIKQKIVSMYYMNEQMRLEQKALTQELELVEKRNFTFNFIQNMNNGEMASTLQSTIKQSNQLYSTIDKLLESISTNNVNLELNKKTVNSVYKENKQQIGIHSLEDLADLHTALC